jgi:hypothetical protein
VKNKKEKKFFPPKKAPRPRKGRQGQGRQGKAKEGKARPRLDKPGKAIKLKNNFWEKQNKYAAQ